MCHLGGTTVSDDRHSRFLGECVLEPFITWAMLCVTAQCEGCWGATLFTQNKNGVEGVIRHQL